MAIVNAVWPTEWD